MLPAMSSVSGDAAWHPAKRTKTAHGAPIVPSDAPRLRPDDREPKHLAPSPTPSRERHEAEDASPPESMQEQLQSTPPNRHRAPPARCHVLNRAAHPRKGRHRPSRPRMVAKRSQAHRLPRKKIGVSCTTRAPSLCWPGALCTLLRIIVWSVVAGARQTASIWPQAAIASRRFLPRTRAKKYVSYRIQPCRAQVTCTFAVCVSVRTASCLLQVPRIGKSAFGTLPSRRSRCC